MVKQARAAGLGVLVLDPSNQPWDCDYKTTDTDEFISVVFANQRCLVIVDEAAEAIGQARSREHEGRIKLATRTRHRGHSVIFISQYASTVNAGVRRQCQKAWIFRQSYDDIKTLSKELCNPDAMQAANLGPGECLYATNFGHISKINVFELDKRVLGDQS